MHFFKVIDLFRKLLRCLLHFFLVSSPVSKPFAYLALILRLHYAICWYMFTVGFHYNFRQITASFSAGKLKQSVVSDKLLIWYSWFEYSWFIKLDLVTVKNFTVILVVYLVAQMITSMSSPAHVCLNYALRDAQNVCANLRRHHS